MTGRPEPEDAVVAAGGWCAPVGPMYDFLRLWTVDDVAWDRPDWNALVAPRLTAVLRARAEARRRLRQARWLLVDVRDVLLHGEERS